MVLASIPSNMRHGAGSMAIALLILFVFSSPLLFAISASDPAYLACDWGESPLGMRAQRLTESYDNAWETGGAWYPAIDKGLSSTSILDANLYVPSSSLYRITEFSTEDYLALSAQTLEENSFSSPDSSGLNVPGDYSPSAMRAADSLEKSNDYYNGLLAQYAACQSLTGQCGLSAQELAMSLFGADQASHEASGALIYSSAIKEDYAGMVGSKFAAISESSKSYNAEIARLESAVYAMNYMGVECPGYSNKQVKDSYYQAKELLSALSGQSMYSGSYAYAGNLPADEESTRNLFSRNNLPPNSSIVLNYSGLGAARNFNLIFSGPEDGQPLLLTVWQERLQLEASMRQMGKELTEMQGAASDAKTKAEKAKAAYSDSGSDLVIGYYVEEHFADSMAADELYGNASQAFDYAQYPFTFANNVTYKIYDYGAAASLFTKSSEFYSDLKAIAGDEVASRRESVQAFHDATNEKLATLTSGLGSIAKELALRHLSSAQASLDQSGGKDLYQDMLYIDDAREDIAIASGIITNAGSSDTGWLETETSFAKLQALIYASEKDGLSVSIERPAYNDMIWGAKLAIASGLDILPYEAQSDSMYAHLLARVAENDAPLQLEYSELLVKAKYLGKTDSLLRPLAKYFGPDGGILATAAAGHRQEISSALSNARQSVIDGEPAALSSILASNAKTEYPVSEAQVGRDTQFSIIVFMSNPTTLSQESSTRPEGIRVPLNVGLEVSNASVSEGLQGISVQSVSGKTITLLVTDFAANDARKIVISATARFATMSQSAVAETVSSSGAKYSAKFAVAPSRDLELAKLALPVPPYYSDCSLLFQGKAIAGVVANDGFASTFNAEFGPLYGASAYKDIEVDCSNPTPYRVSQSETNVTIFNNQLNMWSEYTISDSIGEFSSPLVEIVLPQAIDKSAFRVESSSPQTQITSSQIAAGAGFSLAKIKLQSISPGQEYSFRVYGISDQASEYVGSYVDFASARISGLGMAGKYSSQLNQAVSLYSAGDYAGAYNAAFAALKSAESSYNLTSSQQADYDSAHEQASAMLEKTISRYYNLSSAFDSTDAAALSMISKAQTHLADAEGHASKGNYSQALKSANLALSDLASNALIDFQNKMIAKGISANLDKLSDAQKSLGTASDAYLRIAGVREQINSILKSLPLSNGTEFDSGLGQIAALEGQAVKLSSDSQAVGQDLQMRSLDSADEALALAEKPLQYLESSYSALSKSKSFKPAFDPKKKRAELQSIASDVAKLRAKATPETGYSASTLALAESSEKEAGQLANSIISEILQLNSTSLALSGQASNLSSAASALATKAGEPYLSAAAKPQELAIVASQEYESGDFSASLAASEDSIARSKQLIASIPPESSGENGLLPVAVAAILIALAGSYLYINYRKSGCSEEAEAGDGPGIGHEGRPRKLERKRED